MVRILQKRVKSKNLHQNRLKSILNNAIMYLKQVHNNKSVR